MGISGGQPEYASVHSWERCTPTNALAIVPYTAQLDHTKNIFNGRLNRARLQVESAFGCPKGRFCPLLTHMDIEEQNIPDVVGASCVLPNLVKYKGETFLLGWVAEAACEGRGSEHPLTAVTQQSPQAGGAHAESPEGDVLEGTIVNLPRASTLPSLSIPPLAPSLFPSPTSQ